ncbi:hypothetical protein KY084_08775 [Stakelama sp. CBK3Z-3]|uniref:Flap endonuclease-1-like 5' DNA nuclease n=2 Tax=Stakelama flava TaxID=2860338 RepID=A0ABS6XL75_9SPHN|nr:hypothetical protein [Stakelama flava]
MHLILIVIFAILAILALWWGARLKRERKDGVDALEQDDRLQRVDSDKAVPAPGKPSATQPDMPPTAPAPPPVAGGETIATPQPVPSAVPPVPAEPAVEPVAAAPAPPAPPVAPLAPAPAGDTLTTLKGVGPKVAAKLNELGITSFAELAALSPEQAAAIDAEMGNFKGRMARDRWQEQAALLAAGDRAGYEAKFGKLG